MKYKQFYFSSSLVSITIASMFSVLPLQASDVISASVDDIFSPEAHQRRLPPSPHWQGKTMRFIAEKDSQWVTPAEQTDFKKTATYKEVTNYLTRLAEAHDELHLASLDKLPGQYDMWMMVASTVDNKTPEGLKASGKPTLLIQAGIHPGESMGTDAGLMMMRDLVQGEHRALLEKVNVLFIPIVNITGHERSSAHGRMNQNGPENQGWRANYQNLNLNRDFSKLDSPEIRAVVKVMDQWQPHMYIDAHSTDGINYQYDITWNNNGDTGLSPAGYRWLKEYMNPQVTENLKKEGHIPGPSIDANNPKVGEEGFYPYFSDGPRFSNAYTDARQIPGVLLELHALKPYQQRVLGAYAFFIEVMRAVGDHRNELLDAVAEDQKLRPETITLEFTDTNPVPMVDFKGFKYEKVKSDISGAERIIWTADPIDMKVPMTSTTQAKVTAQRPKAYWIPAGWNSVIERLKAHGVEMETIEKPITKTLSFYRVEDAKVTNALYEGRTRVAGTPLEEKMEYNFPAGSVRISTDQALGSLAVLLLEPESLESFFQWGFFNAMLTQFEYGSGYILEPTAEAMLNKDENLRKRFEQKLKEDEDFANDPEARLAWFHKLSPFYDKRAYLYPVGIEK